MTRRSLRAMLPAIVAAMLGVGVHAADIDGDWNLVFQTQAGPRESSLHVTTDGDRARATLGETELAGTCKDGVFVLEGQHYASEAGYSDTLRLEGKLLQGELRGESRWGEYASTFVGTRARE